jgi:hypothetical protein
MKTTLSNTTLSKLWRLLPRKHKKRLFLVALVLFIGALADPQVVEEHELFMGVYQAFGAPGLSTFLLANLFMTVTVYVQHMYVQSVAAFGAFLATLRYAPVPSSERQRMTRASDP